MHTGAATKVEDVRWDLSPIYQGPDDPAIARDEEEVDRRVAAFQSYRGTLSEAAADAAHVEKIIKDIEAIQIRIHRLYAFASLGAAISQDDPKKLALLARIQERYRRWSAQVVFATLDLRRLPIATIERLAGAPALLPYRHFLLHQAALAPHTLSEAEEKVILKKNIGGRDAQVRFREEFTGRLDFGTLHVNGDEKQMTFASLISLQENPDRDVRLRARTRLNETFLAHLPVFGFLFTNVVKDHGVEAELRGYAEPIDVENVPNEIPGIVVKNLLDLARKHLPSLHAYYAWKASRLGVPRLRTCDLMAPYPGTGAATIPWSESRDLVTGAFARLDPAMAGEVGLFFDEGRLDAGPRRAKRAGAFCSPVPGLKPHVLLSYTETLGSLVTLAHELGHGVHFILSASEQPYLQAYGMSKVIAETASEFGECLLRDHVLETTKDDVLRRQIAVSEVERFINVVYRQLLFTEFEMKVHEMAARQPLTADALSDLWVELARDHYGPNVEMLETDRAGWATIGHFVFNPFYCYSYALSQVVVLALYRKWKREGGAFLPQFLALLRGGSSGTPAELLARAGIDLHDPTVLEEAFREFEERVQAAREVIG
jgi:oligoendopeptidase F